MTFDSVQREQTDFVTRNEIAVVHVRVAIDEGAVEHRVPHTAGLVLDPSQRLIGIDINDIEETILVLIALFSDQPTLHQFFVRTGKIGQRDLDMMSVVFREIGTGFAISDLAFTRARSPCIRSSLVLRHASYAPK